MTKDLDQIEEQDPDEATAALEQAATLMAKAAKDRKNRDVLLKEAEAALAKVPIGLMPDLAESPVVKTLLSALGIKDLQPGQVANKGTVVEREREWTWADVNATFALKTFTPDESLPLTFQGLTLHIFSGEECTIPECFYEIWRQHKYAMKQAAIHERYLLGQSDKPPDPNYFTDETARVRAFSMLGPRGQSAGTLTTGRVIIEPTKEEGA